MLDGNGVYIVTIVNTAGVELPATGGSGIAPFIVVGMTLMVLSAAVLVWFHKREIA